MFDDDERDYCGDLYPQGKHSFGEEEAPYHHHTRKPRKRWSRSGYTWSRPEPEVWVPGALKSCIDSTAWYLDENELNALRAYGAIRERLTGDKWSQKLHQLGLLDKRKSIIFATFRINENGKRALEIRA